MQPVEIRIPGDFWDSFIYNGRLYLFTLDGDIRVYRWEQLVDSISIASDYRPLFSQYFTRGQDWYSRKLQRILQSTPILQTVRSLTQHMADQFYEIPPQKMQAALIGTTASPSHPHTDIEGFYSVLYVSSLDGIYAVSLKRKLADRFLRMTDVPALRVACSWGSMVVAAGSEGMFDHTLTELEDWSVRPEPRQLANTYCMSCSWASFDVIGTSTPGDAGFVAAFSRPEPDENESQLSLGATSRNLLGLINSESLFPSADGLLFGNHDILAMASRSALHIDGWNPRLRDETAKAVDLQQALFSEKTLEVGELTEDPIDGAATVYGILVEMDSALLLRGVDGTISAFGQPVNWRTFPRSRHYLNQLHATYDSYVSIRAFPDDYLISEKDRERAVQRPHPAD